jgi:hypothetical protein
MLHWSRWLRAAAGGTAAILLALALPAGATGSKEFWKTRPSTDARQLVDWVVQSGDPQGRPFAVVDKRAARIYIFHADGSLAGHSPALLGSTVGDHTVPGVGLRAQSGEVGEDERTTPAGRFESTPGFNNKGEHVVWVDYASAFAIHRLRPGLAYNARASRLATAKAAHSRVSWGCVVVPVRFYEEVVEPVLGRERSVVYVMPEATTVKAMFQALDGR